MRICLMQFAFVVLVTVVLVVTVISVAGERAVVDCRFHRV